MSARQLRARRRALAARLGDVQQVLAGSLTEQSRRCGRPGCRCSDGEPHGPYAYFTRRYLQRSAEVEAVLAEISAINAELLARRELR